MQSKRREDERHYRADRPLIAHQQDTNADAIDLNSKRIDILQLEISMNKWRHRGQGALMTAILGAILKYGPVIIKILNEILNKN